MNLYPPGTPMAVPGEIIDDALISRVTDCIRRGLKVQGVRREGSDIYLSVLVQPVI